MRLVPACVTLVLVAGALTGCGSESSPTTTTSAQRTTTSATQSTTSTTSKASSGSATTKPAPDTTSTSVNVTASEVSSQLPQGYKVDPRYCQDLEVIGVENARNLVSDCHREIQKAIQDRGFVNVDTDGNGEASTWELLQAFDYPDWFLGNLGYNTAIRSDAPRYPEFFRVTGPFDTPEECEAARPNELQPTRPCFLSQDDKYYFEVWADH